LIAEKFVEIAPIDSSRKSDGFRLSKLDKILKGGRVRSKKLICVKSKSTTILYAGNKKISRFSDDFYTMKKFCEKI